MLVRPTRPRPHQAVSPQPAAASHAGHARPPGRPDPLLALTSEVSLALQLVVRHRAPRLAGAVAAGVAGLVAASDAWAPPASSAAPTRLVIAAGLAVTVTAVAAARLLAPGPAFHAARHAAQSVPMALVGRALAVMLLLAVPTAALLVLLGHNAGDTVPGAVGVALLEVAAVTAVTMALTPHVGAFAAGGLVGAVMLLGIVPPDAAADLVWRVVPIQPLAVMLTVAWHFLPLPWRVVDGSLSNVVSLVLIAALGGILARNAVQPWHPRQVGVP